MSVRSLKTPLGPLKPEPARGVSLGEATPRPQGTTEAGTSDSAGKCRGVWRDVLSAAPCRVTSNHLCHHHTGHFGTSANGHSQVHGHGTHGDAGHHEVHGIHAQLRDAVHVSVNRLHHSITTDPRHFRDLYRTPTK